MWASYTLAFWVEQVQRRSFWQRLLPLTIGSLIQFSTKASSSFFPRIKHGTVCSMERSSSLSLFCRSMSFSLPLSLTKYSSLSNHWFYKDFSTPKYLHKQSPSEDRACKLTLVQCLPLARPFLQVGTSSILSISFVRSFLLPLLFSVPCNKFGTRLWGEWCKKRKMSYFRQNESK